ncbi:hypothetical protein [Microvirga lotononidis]|uniref:Uncharacterized protein n=1 Tax=Microvirga lotononidis TaxID=864069 RepID=I4YRU3_9HYPH|nr:hypothetical protein [Microvirga lotononidis]EIM26685.1 hypothetical protein MicloDRAFT_00032350 [Microvirga lotononidis]
MPALNLFKRNSDKPRLSIRERFHNAAARMMLRSRGSRAGGGIDTSRRAMVAGSLASVVVAPIGAMAAPEADTELLRLAREHDVAYGLAVSGNLEGEAFDECMDLYTDLEFAIQDIPAQTWAGLVEKARVASEYAYDQADVRVLDNIIPSLIDDILRLAGASSKRPIPPSQH